jgi:hypothetical protein
MNNSNREKEVGRVGTNLCTNSIWSNFEAFVNVTGATGRYI